MLPVLSNIAKNFWAVMLVCVLRVVGANAVENNASAGTNVVFKTAQTHSIKYYLSLPIGWSKEKKWPLVVTCAPLGSSQWATEKFAMARGDRPLIIVAPLIVSNSGHPDEGAKKQGYTPEVIEKIMHDGAGHFDEEGILAVAKETQAEYVAEKLFFVTGFSAGGHATWLMVFFHPEKLAGAALAAGNYIGRGMGGRLVSTAPVRTMLPIREFYGLKDNPILLAQWTTASSLAMSNRYQNLSLKEIPGIGHDPFFAEIIDYFYHLRFF